jgi:hypothetical protein
MILDALKKRLHDATNAKGGKWMKELPNAIWGLRTQPTKPTGQSPYFLIYSFEAILPADVMWQSPTVEQYEEGVVGHTPRVLMQVRMKMDSYYNSPVILLALVPCNPTRTPAL